jgi:hypothetical protein
VEPSKPFRSRTVHIGPIGSRVDEFACERVAVAVDQRIDAHDGGSHRTRAVFPGGCRSPRDGRLRIDSVVFRGADPARRLSPPSINRLRVATGTLRWIVNFACALPPPPPPPAYTDPGTRNRVLSPLPRAPARPCRNDASRKPVAALSRLQPRCEARSCAASRARRPRCRRPAPQALYIACHPATARTGRHVDGPHTCVCCCGRRGGGAGVPVLVHRRRGRGHDWDQ